MKRQISGLVTFFSCVAIGLFAARFLYIAPATPNPKLEDLNIPTMILRSSNEIENFSPEFRNVKIADQDIPFKLQLGLDGEFTLRKCELDSVREKGRWLGLFKKGNSYSVERTNLKVGRPETDYYGAWYPISFKNSRTASFLFTDDGSLRLGPAKTFYEVSPLSFVDEDEKTPVRSMTIGFSKYFNQSNIDSTIRVAPGTDEYGNQVGVVILEHGDKRQILYYQGLPGGIDMPIADLDWVGDLDGDGFLDLRISYFELNGGGQNSILFLSSKAPDGSLVKAYAISRTRNPGC